MHTAKPIAQKYQISLGISLFFAVILAAGGVMFLIIAVSPGWEEDWSPTEYWIVRVTSVIFGFVGLVCALPLVMYCRFLLTGKKRGICQVRVSKSTDDGTDDKTQARG